MMKVIILGVLVLISAGCGTDQKTSQQAPAGGSQTANVKAYPVDWCIVTGEKLGSMGDPVSRTYQGQEVKFCCKHCIEEFDKTPTMYLARIDSAAAGLVKPHVTEGHGG